jgi:hypothetical protein
MRVSIPLHHCETGGDVHILMGRDKLVLRSTHQSISVRDTINARPAWYPRTLRWITDGTMKLITTRRFWSGPVLPDQFQRGVGAPRFEVHQSVWESEVDTPTVR